MGRSGKTPSRPPEPRIVHVRVPVGFQHWAHIYEPMKVHPADGRQPRFSIRLPYEAFPEDMMPDLNVRGPHKFDLALTVHASSPTSPEVSPPRSRGIDGLVAELARLDARNVRRDEIFVGQELIVDLEARRFKDLPWGRYGPSFTWPPERWVLTLKKVRIQ